MAHVDAASSRLALIVGHTAGMIDMVSLPIWVGALLAGYGYTPAQAGGLVTAFLIGVVVASSALAPLFHRWPMRWVPALGFAGASLAFLGLWFAPGFSAFLVLHLSAGLCVGAALSATHGTIGRTRNPHRTFAFATIGFGIFGALFVVFAVQVIAATAPASLFLIFAGIMAIAATVMLILFPASEAPPPTPIAEPAPAAAAPRFKPAVWLLIAGLLGMNFNQSMNFSFVERVGIDQGWPASSVSGVLIAVALVSLLSAPLAVLLEKRLNPLHVGMAGALLQALLSLGVTSSPAFAGYAACACLIPFVMIFSHTFLFGLMSREEPTGRAVAANPAITMGGGALGPLMGGILVQTLGYGGLSAATAFVSTVVIATLLWAGGQMLARPVVTRRAVAKEPAR
ncbi:MFS transporter [Ancylobacter sp. IITR112]|uniref:MFS transporter n=1 Tax=Ancylobacter sp. IITR112 TaxID=3138073 RepID=UPI00352BB844